MRLASRETTATARAPGRAVGRSRVLRGRLLQAWHEESSVARAGSQDRCQIHRPIIPTRNPFVSPPFSIRVRVHRSQDGNGDPKSDSPRGIPLLGIGDGRDLLSTGRLMGKILSPSGLAGSGMFSMSPYPKPAYSPH